ncbi:MAG: translocation/assembly module TamB domain-containing protein, partial [Cyanobium sp.]
SPWRYGNGGEPWGGLVSAELQRNRALLVRLTARPPGPLRLPSGPLQAVLRGRWRDGALRGTTLDLASGASSLQLSGTLGRRFDLGGWWRLDPSDLPQAERLPPWLRSRPLAGRLALRGPLGSPQLEVATQLQQHHPVFGAWQAALRWDQGLVRLERFEARHLSAQATLPLQFRRGRGAVIGPLAASLELREFPLAALGPLVGTRLEGTLAGKGRVSGPLSALVPDLTLSVRGPGAGPLRLHESWSGRLEGMAGGGGLLRLRARPPGLDGRITARLDPRWRPLELLLERAGGRLSLDGDPRLYRWRAQAFPLDGLQLQPAGSHPLQPLAGVLSGTGELALQPLAFSGDVAIRQPAVFGLAGRELTATLRYGDRQYALRGTVLPLSGGRIDGQLSGQWRGPFQARFQGRQLSSLLFREMARAWDGWRGVIGPWRGRAADLGRPAIETVGMALQEQLAVLETTRDRLEALDLEQRRTTRAERLARLQMRVDADLAVQGPDLRRARARLEGRGHLWLNQSDRDLALARDPFEVRLEGPLFSGGGTFSVSGLTLSLLSLLTPVPDSLRGYLSVAGRYRLGGRRPELQMDLALDQAELAATGLRLERGRLELGEKGLDMDLALLAQGASSTVDLSGLLPLTASSRTLQLRMSSRGDGLRFLTALTGRAVQWRKGSVDLQLLVRGSLEDPIANGFLRFREGEYGFIGQTLQGVEATVLFDFEQMLVQGLSARVGPKGRISGEGRLGLVRPLSADPTLAVELQGVPFAMERIKAVADGRLALGGSLAAPSLGGSVAISRGVINAQPGQLARLEEGPGPAAAPPKGGATAQAPAAPGPLMRPTSMNDLLQRRWAFQEPLVLLGPEVESSTNVSLQEAIPNLPWLRFEDLRLAFGPDLRVVLPAIANFTTAGALRISGRLDPSLRASGVVRLLAGRLNLFTTTFGLDPDAPNVAVFTPSLGLVPYLDIALRSRIADNLNAFAPSSLGDPGLQILNAPTERDPQTGLSPLSQIKLIRVTVSVSGPADRIAENLRLRSNPPLPQERLIALIGGNSLAGLRGGQAGTALATALGQTLLSPLLGSLSDALGQRVSFALYPTYVTQAVASGEERFSGRVPPRLVLAGEVGLDLTDRLSASVLAVPNRSDVPAQINLNYKASNTWNIGASIDTEGAWQTVLQFFFRF